MELNKLNTFIDLSHTLSYTETAENLFTTQGNISKQILSLEKELGVTLFKREHRKIDLTTDGELVLGYAQQITNLSAELNSALARTERTKNHQLLIKTIPSIMNYRALNLITQFQSEQDEEINLNLTEDEAVNLLDSIKGETDIIFTRMFKELSPEYAVIPSEEDRFVAVLPRGHALTKFKKINLADLATEKWLLLDDDTQLLQPIKKLIKQVGINPQINYEGKRPNLIMEMVSRSSGVSLMMEKVAQSEANANVELVPIAENISSVLGFVRNKEHNTAASDLFWDYLQHSIPE
ncbi:LysR family transcriptional regulator [Weissella muntiaci]|uniref:LysR family transcriptional regulator n=1 Tax=Weissella muntiaci TaxID=2508881 RepID=A0A6C2CCQ2_9LACO|nr:LysR family transcriptional regulator [Weissella muntiaci]TYC50975.1 LysR family transcriptional regulator [Weissella muntiaci]